MSLAATLAPLTASSFAIQVHVAAAVIALLLGLWQLLAQKGTGPHRLLGRLWVVAMATIALTSFWITGVNTPGRYSPIHALSVFVLIMLPLAILFARRGNIRAHKMTMTIMYFSALVLTGLFTLLPGRVMHRVFFG
jgi:uncharacterized membrane protein